MNYQRIYDRLIERAKATVYNEPTELHHIVPKSQQGSDEESNLVKVPVRLHFVLHELLYKIHKTTHPEIIFACPMFFLDARRKNTLRGQRKLPRWIRRAAHLLQQKKMRERNPRLYAAKLL